jgi:hypothetical protein
MKFFLLIALFVNLCSIQRYALSVEPDYLSSVDKFLLKTAEFKNVILCKVAQGPQNSALILTPIEVIRTNITKKTDLTKVLNSLEITDLYPDKAVVLVLFNYQPLVLGVSSFMIVGVRGGYAQAPLARGLTDVSIKDIAKAGNPKK